MRYWQKARHFVPTTAHVSTRTPSFSLGNFILLSSKEFNTLLSGWFSRVVKLVVDKQASFQNSSFCYSTQFRHCLVGSLLAK